MKKVKKVIPQIEDVAYIQLLSTGTKAFYNKSVGHFVSENRRFHTRIETAIDREDMHIQSNK